MQGGMTPRHTFWRRVSDDERVLFPVSDWKFLHELRHSRELLIVGVDFEFSCRHMLHVNSFLFLYSLLERVDVEGTVRMLIPHPRRFGEVNTSRLLGLIPCIVVARSYWYNTNCTESGIQLPSLCARTSTDAKFLSIF